ncbi:MAG: KOW motif domain-containing protein [Candidatus Bathyarchaeia archaeon]
MVKPRHKIQLKRGDRVVVIAGGLAEKDENGKFSQVGTIVNIDRENERVQIENVTKGKKKTIPRRQNAPGQLVDRHEWIHISNVMLVDKYEKRWEKRHQQATK